jgi:hypothetical protein
MISLINLGILIPVLFVGIILYGVFTREGKSMFVKVGFGKIIKDCGDIGSSKIWGMPQTLHLYECFDSKENFFVLEVRTLGNIHYSKISKESAQNFINLVSSSYQNISK